ncbi:MAG: hypothetical protein ACYS0C_08395 [Planctomycetota bacterium]
MGIVNDFKQKIIAKSMSVVLPEGNDERILQAARILKDKDIKEGSEQ